MLIIVRKFRDLHFSQLMDVYEESNRILAEERYPDEYTQTGIHLVREDFYQYLKDCFFRNPGAKICIWEENACYVSALRLEPYMDGVLITGLESAPKFRRKGYATVLMKEVLSQLEGDVYSHVGKNNTASVLVHEKCGFSRIKESARFIDGSVDFRTYTMHVKK